MNHLKSLKISNSPLLLVACSILSFSVTNFYFSNAENQKITNIIGQILLFPVYIIDGIFSFLGSPTILSNPITIFLILLITYSGIVFIGGKIFQWRNQESE
jgi:hypothetical protein